MTSIVSTSYASGTVLNALATGIGCAFAIDLKTRVKLKVDEDLRSSFVVGGDKNSNLIATRILSTFGIKAEIRIKSEIPVGVGLGSSSAFLNGLIVSAMKAIGEELNAFRILRANARFALEFGMSFTGAFDDASASLLGGLVVSDNYRMKLYKREILNDYYAAILIPFDLERMKVNFKEIRKRSLEIVHLLKFLFSNRYDKVMIENTKFYANVLGYPLEIVKKPWKEGICCGLSGNGPSFVGFGKKDEMKVLANYWNDFGKVKVRKIQNKSPERIEIPDYLFL